jgi:hypothetical protein
VLGWKIDINSTSGAVSARAYNDFAALATNQGVTFSKVGVFVPPFLTFNTTWYIELTATGQTSYTITSQPVSVQRTWAMPAAGGTVTTPGVPTSADPTDFGDSGIDATGNALPGDHGIDLGNSDWHFYVVTVPQNNLGLLRTKLDAINGNPDLFLRAGAVPTTTHRSSGSGGDYLVDDELSEAVNTEYGNWVPLNGRTTVQLTPGTWYLGVRAGGSSNARYRLHTSLGQFQALNLSGTMLTSQTMAGGDWRYYYVDVPENAPTGLSLTFAEQLGDVVVYARDTVPPGEAHYNAVQYPYDQYIYDWQRDYKNEGPYPSYNTPGTYSLPLPPLRPASRYWFGVRAKNDATFSIGVTAAGSTINLPAPVALEGGQINTTVQPGATATYVVPVPPVASRFKYSSTHPGGVEIRVEQGTLPTPTGPAHFSSGISQANSSLDQALSVDQWPWQPDQDYYVMIRNTTSSPQAVSVTFNGANKYTEDDNNDGLPDFWEIQYFGNINASGGANASPANDGVPNLMKYALGLDPTHSAVDQLPQPTVENGYLTMTVMKPSYPVIVNYTLESAGDLNGTSFSASTTTVLVDNSMMLKVRDNVPITSRTRRFMRLKISR